MERWRKNKRDKQRRKEEKDGGREEKKDGNGRKKTRRINTHEKRSQKHLTTSKKYPWITFTLSIALFPIVTLVYNLLMFRMIRHHYTVTKTNENLTVLIFI